MILSEKAPSDAGDDIHQRHHKNNYADDKLASMDSMFLPPNS
jgi:hypothetical protein